MRGDRATRWERPGLFGLVRVGLLATGAGRVSKGRVTRPMAPSDVGCKPPLHHTEFVPVAALMDAYRYAPSPYLGPGSPSLMVFPRDLLPFPTGIK